MAANIKTKADIQKELDKTKKELEEFKQKVLDKAVAMQEDYGYCDGGLNDFLGSVGLEAPGTDWNYSVSFQVNLANETDLSNNDVKQAFTAALESLSAKNSKIKGVEETKSSGYPNYTATKTGIVGFNVTVDDVYEN